eukprot:m.134253 g.134253  ORF g.134253 m.134253 type:complete len:142 (-) comp52441_c0_seq24:253-678(-)
MGWAARMQSLDTDAHLGRSIVCLAGSQWSRLQVLILPLLSTWHLSRFLTPVLCAGTWVPVQGELLNDSQRGSTVKRVTLRHTLLMAPVWSGCSHGTLFFISPSSVVPLVVLLIFPHAACCTSFAGLLDDGNILARQQSISD